MEFFITALALAPTAEKDLVDIQRHICEKSHCPAALALPPVWPLFREASPPDAARRKAIRGEKLPRLCFAEYRMRGNILCAAPSAPALYCDVEKSGADGQFPPRLPGFYLADTGSSGFLQENLYSLPPLPAYTVKALRLIVMEVITAQSVWWKAVSWKLISEEWVKLL